MADRIRALIAKAEADRAEYRRTTRPNEIMVLTYNVRIAALRQCLEIVESDDG